MNPKINQAWIPVEKIEELVQLEPALAILGLAFAAWVIYKTFLRDLSDERHRNMQSYFRNLGLHIFAAASLFLTYTSIRLFAPQTVAVERVISYLGLITLLSCAVVFVKTARIMVFEYLFIGHMKTGVPLVLVNLFTLLLSLVLGGWIATEVFSIRLVPLLATSAIFSIILGLALQDTLGNLFSAIALQLDKPYEIGDWTEVQQGIQRWVGQVHEISWRATLMLGMSDEAITIPNRIVGQSQISNFSRKSQPIARTQIFRLRYGCKITEVKELLARAASAIPTLHKDIPPYALVMEAGEMGVGFKLIYFVDNYGSQFLIADQVITACLQALEKAGYETAIPRMAVIQTSLPAHAL